MLFHRPFNSVRHENSTNGYAYMVILFSLLCSPNLAPPPALATQHFNILLRWSVTNLYFISFCINMKECEIFLWFNIFLFYGNLKPMILFIYFF